MAALPNVGGDNNIWGSELNTFLLVGHNTNGTVILDTNAANVTQDGTAGTGSTGIPISSGHSHPAPGWVMSDNNLLAATASLDSLGTGALTTAGTLYLNKIPIRYNMTASNLWITISTSGSGTSTGSFLGLYSSAGVLLGQTNDMTTVSILSGARSYPLQSNVALTGGTFIYGALITNLSTTQPTIRQYMNGSTAGANLNISSAASFRCATNGTGLTSLATLPTPLTLSSNATATASPYWMGIN